MIHPLVRLLATQPQLLAEHLGGYAALMGAEIQQVKNRALMHLLLLGLSLSLLAVALVLVGVSLMMWAVSADALSTTAGWVLVLVPLAPVIGAGVAFWFAQRPAHDPAFAKLQLQLAADAQMFNEVGAA